MSQHLVFFPICLRGISKWYIKERLQLVLNFNEVIESQKHLNVQKWHYKLRGDSILFERSNCFGYEEDWSSQLIVQHWWFV